MSFTQAGVTNNQQRNPTAREAVTPPMSFTQAGVTNKPAEEPDRASRPAAAGDTHGRAVLKVLSSLAPVREPLK